MRIQQKVVRHKEQVKPASFTSAFETVPDFVKEQQDWEESVRSVPVKFFTESMFTPQGGDFTDPVTKKTQKSRIVEVRWLEAKAMGDGLAYRPAVLTGKKALDYIREADGRYMAARAKGIKSGRLRENFATGGGFNNVAGISNEFIPIPPGPYYRQLYLRDMWEMQAKAFEMYNHNPVAHGIIAIKTAFVVGNGIRVSCKDENAQDVVDEFISSTNFNARIQTWSDMASINGEGFYEPYRVKPGYIDFNYVDPPTIWEIITNPRNIHEVMAYWMQYQTQYQLYTVKNTPTSDYVIEQLPPDRLLHLKLNVHENEKRGRSDLFSVMSYLRYLNVFYRAKVQRATAEACYVFDHLVKGGPADVRRVAAQYTQFQQPGSRFFHNEAELLSVMGFNGAAVAKSEIGDELLNLISVGTGIPKEYLGSSQGGSRAMAVISTDPFGKLISQRRQKWEAVIRKMMRRVIQEAVLASRIPKPKDWDFEVAWDEISPENSMEKLQILSGLQTAGVISHRRFSELASHEADIENYDYDSEQQEIEQERQQDAQSFAGEPGNPQPDLFPAPSGKGGSGTPGAGAGKGTFGQDSPFTPIVPKLPGQGLPKTASAADKNKIKDSHRAL